MCRRDQELLQASHQPCGHDDLAGVALRVLGRVEQQAPNRAGKARAAHRPWLGERRLWPRPEPGEGGIDSGVEAGEQVGGLADHVFFLRPQRRALLVGERFAARVGEEPVHGAGDVEKVKGEGGRARRSSAKLLGGEARHGSLHFLARLHEGVSDGLKRRRNTGDGPPEPRFGQVLPLRLAHAGPSLRILDGQRGQ